MFSREFHGFTRILPIKRQTFVLSPAPTNRGGVVSFAQCWRLRQYGEFRNSLSEKRKDLAVHRQAFRKPSVRWSTSPSGQGLQALCPGPDGIPIPAIAAGKNTQGHHEAQPQSVPANGQLAEIQFPGK